MTTRDARGVASADAAQSDISQIDFRVGEIKHCEAHPDSEKLLVEMIDVGEDEPRQICSGIADFYVNPSDLEGARVVIVANLKERRMAGTPSKGMLLCASQGKSEGTEPHALVVVQAPPGAAVGERIIIEMDGQAHGEPAVPNKVAKKKLYEKIASDLCTDSEGRVCYKESPFMTSAGPCTAPLKNSLVS